MADGQRRLNRNRVRVLQVVRAVVGRMHKAGFVHGDVRAVNVLVCIVAATSASLITGPAYEMVSVILIDYDEAGRVNEAQYSLNEAQYSLKSHRGES